MAIYEVKKAYGNDNVPPVYLLSVYAKYSTFLSIYLCQDCFSIEDYKGPCQGLASTSILTKANDNGWPQFLINIDANQLKATKIQNVILSFFIFDQIELLKGQFVFHFLLFERMTKIKPCSEF